MAINETFEYTIQEISQELNLPKETCRQVLLMALKKLKNPKNKEQLIEAKEILELLKGKS